MGKIVFTIKERHKPYKTASDHVRVCMNMKDREITKKNSRELRLRFLCMPATVCIIH